MTTLTDLLCERKITLEGLRELLLSGAEASTEKTRHVLKQLGIETQKKTKRSLCPPPAKVDRNVEMGIRLFLGQLH
jgi:hypothetical protein